MSKGDVSVRFVWDDNEKYGRVFPSDEAEGMVRLLTTLKTPGCKVTDAGQEEFYVSNPAGQFLNDMITYVEGEEQERHLPKGRIRTN